jgi:membrane protease YdiL (CAAX protease family)
MKWAFKTLGLFLLWTLSVSLSLLLPPVPWGLIPLLVLFWLFLWGVGYAGRPGRARRRRAALRLRPPTAEALGWTVVGMPVLFGVAAAAGTVWAGLVHVPPDSANPFLPLMATAPGRLMVAVYVIAVAPVAEEWIFRGLLQRPLERRLGGARAVALSAALFAGAHLLPRVFPVLFLLGVAFGAAVRASGSIWPAVLLHAAYNAATFTALVAGGVPEEQLTIWETGPTPAWWQALALLLLLLGVGTFLVHRLRKASQPGAARIGRVVPDG